MTRLPRLRLWNLRLRWRELLRDAERPERTAFAFALGTWIGATPILGVHTWAAFGAAALLRLPPLAVVLGSNLSNPITFIPITLLEIRVGSWLLGRPFHLMPTAFTFGDVSSYVVEAWVGWIVVGLAFAVVSHLILATALRRAKRRARSK